MSASNRPVAIARAILATFPLVGVANAQNWFSAPLIFEPGQTLCRGDLDSDGDLDILHFRYPNLVVPLLNGGDASFQAGTTLVLAAATAATNDSATLDDFDNDGNLDLAIALGPFDSPLIAIYRGLGGASFAPPVVLPTTYAAAYLVSGNFDADPARELAAVIGGSTKSIVEIDFNGVTFVSTSTPIAAGTTSIYDVAAGDLNADGLDDLAFSTADSGSVFTAVSTGTSFVAGPTYPNAAAPNTWIGVTIGDLDADGDDDLLAMHRVGSLPAALVICRFTNQGGNLLQGPFESIHAPGTNSFPMGLVDVELGDVDGDGDLDLGGITKFASESSSGAFLVRVENLGATFAGFHTVIATQPGSSGGFGDFDGDGHLDFLANRSLVFGNGSFVSPLSGDLPPSTDLRYASVRDVDDDGDEDVVDQHLIALNDATGTFSDAGAIFPPLPPNLVYGSPRIPGDFDGDGRMDYLVPLHEQSQVIPSHFVFKEMRLLRDDHTGHYVDTGAAALPGVSFQDNSSERVFQVADFDGDGDVDVLGQKGMMFNAGAGFFSSPAVQFSGQPSDVADIDGDGDIDILTHTFGAIELQRKGPGLTWQTELILALHTTEFADVAARFVDLDDDGDLDIAAPSTNLLYPQYSNVFVELVRNASGIFSFHGTLPVGDFPRTSVGVGDVDFDGRSDLLLGGISGHTTVLLRTGPGFTYDPTPRVYQTPGFTRFTDVDSDGDIDLLSAAVLRNTTLDATTGGSIRQYGMGKPGKGGAVPLIGASGPATVSGNDYELRVRRAVGGAPSFLLLGTSEAALPNLPLLGMTLYVGVPFTLVTFPASGAAGVIGDGALTLPVPSIPPVLQGVSVFHQTWHADPAAIFGVSHSNGLAVTFGT